ncbi:MAG: proprotein convertase P-domain-containing protein [Myxococcota bacterium]|nr:proprotein convertase P-domain-containing protein [Myxococcota bacterium]
MIRRTTNHLLSGCLLVGAGLMVGCADDVQHTDRLDDGQRLAFEETPAPTAHDAQQKPDDTGALNDKLGQGKADAWNYRNNPAGLRVTMKTKLADLPMEGETELQAWPDTYWPTYKDSTNHRWQETGNFLDDLSPAEKYDVAFNGWDPNQVKDLRPFDANDCTPDSFDAAYYDKLGPAAQYISTHKGNAKTREAANEGILTDTCRAKEDGECMTACADKPEAEKDQCERRCHRGGVETWWGTCHAWAPAAILEKEPLYPVTVTTPHGEIVFEIGDIKALYSIIYDRTRATLIGGRCNDFDVERDETTGRIISEECRDLNAGSFHVAMANLVGIQKRGFVEDRTFDYEVWNQPVKGYNVHTLEEITTEKAHELLKVDVENPTDCIDGTDVADGGYCYNSDIDQLFRVEATLHWITESHASTVAEGAHNLSAYSRTDRYTYILEVKDGHVVGGEWYGGSIKNHPDFIWLPFEPFSGNPHVSVQRVRHLGAQAQNDPAAPQPETQLVTAERSGIHVDIPDNLATGISDAVEVTANGEASELSVTVDIEHTYIGDLIVTLTSPSGEKHTLHAKEGGSQDNLQKTFSLTNVGEINGAWTLHVSDNYRVDVGALKAWKLDFTIVADDGDEASGPLTVEHTTAIDIPDNDLTGITSHIDVSESGQIAKLEVVLDITHTYIADLIVRIEKDGVSRTLHNRDGGSSDDIKRSYMVEEFAGADSAGRWTLHVSDRAGRDVGVQNRWSVRITH